MKIGYKRLKSAGLIYAGCSAVFFYMGWLNLVFGILFTLLLAGAVFLGIKSSSDDDGYSDSLSVTKKQFIIIALIALIWCILAGQGGFYHQSSDHYIRNAIFRDMIVKPWPVEYSVRGTDYMLSYYIAHWTVPAAAGKALFALSGSKDAAFMCGNIALLIWSFAGVLITLLLFAAMINKGKKSRPVICAVFFILFSGLDVVGTMFTTGFQSMHLEWWASFFQYSSNTTCLFWVYNQSIAAWILTLCIINEKKTKDLALLGLLILPFGPFPFVGALILCLLKGFAMLSERMAKKDVPAFARETFSVQNIMSVVATVPVYMLYYSLNSIVSSDSAGSKPSGFRFHSDLTDAINAGQTGEVISFVVLFLTFILLEFGIWSLIIMKRHKKDPVFIGVNAALCIIPLFQLGYSYDLCMRVSIPLMMYICVSAGKFMAEELPGKGEYPNLDSLVKSKPLFTVAAFVFMLGAAVPATEFARETVHTFTDGPELANARDFFESLEDTGLGENFTATGYKDSWFYNVMCR